MFLSVHLRKPGRLGGIYGVAANTESRNVGQDWLYGSRIIRMFGERPVTGLAVYVSMNTLRFDFEYVRVAGLAGVMARKFDRTRTDLGQSGSTIRTVPPKALWDHSSANGDEYDCSGNENENQSDQMSRVFKIRHEEPHEQRERRQEEDQKCLEAKRARSRPDRSEKCSERQILRPLEHIAGMTVVTDQGDAGHLLKVPRMNPLFWEAWKGF
jgi:hypothetical protein